MALKTLRERFEEKVDYNGPINPKTGTRCHIWTANRLLPAYMDGRSAALPEEDGYGRIYVDGKQKLAHRIAWELYVGPIPHNQDIDHDDDEIGCKRKACVNVEHLAPTTTNSRRRKDNSTGEWGIYWNRQREIWFVKIRVGNSRTSQKTYTPAEIGLPCTYVGDPPPAKPPRAAIDSRDKLRAHLGLPK